MPKNGPDLRDIHVPYVSMWWPLAPGWWVAIGVFVVALVALVWFLRRRRAWHRYVDGTLRELRDAEQRHAGNGDTAAFATVASQLVRRVARTRDPRMVSLRGEAWTQALAGLAPKHDVTRLSALDDAMYRPGVALDIAATSRDAQAWVRAVLRRPSGKGAHVPA